MSTQTLPSFAQLFGKLSADELGTLINALAPINTAIQNTDGSPASLLGIWLQLQGIMTSNVSLFEKVGILDVWNLAITELNNLQQLAAAAASSASGASSGSGTANPPAPPAPEPAPAPAQA